MSTDIDCQRSIGGDIHIDRQVVIPDSGLPGYMQEYEVLVYPYGNVEVKLYSTSLEIVVFDMEIAVCS
jgi:hypothetical protein